MVPQATMTWHRNGNKGYPVVSACDSATLTEPIQRRFQRRESPCDIDLLLGDVHLHGRSQELPDLGERRHGTQEPSLRSLGLLAVEGRMRKRQGSIHPPLILLLTHERVQPVQHHAVDQQSLYR
jgi:hypothetical protein